jgi:hypothetical protein
MRRSRLLASATLAATLALSAPSAALAGPPDNTNPNCFGQSASYIARGLFYFGPGVEMNMGEHASSQDEPRLGIKNTARYFDFEHQSDLALALGSGTQGICVDYQPSP